MNVQIEEIINLFHNSMPTHFELKEIWQEENDSRWVLFVEFPKEKYVIKIASNTFTTKEKVCGWQGIIDEYEKIGYYSPAILKSISGNYCELVMFGDKECLVWEEEYAKYNLHSTLDKSVYIGPDEQYVYYDEVLEFVAKVGEKHLSNFPCKSGWLRFEPFTIEDTTDEIEECVDEFEALIKEKAPHFMSRWNKIYDMFTENKRWLKAVYYDLPTSVFQADFAGDNLLFDDNGHLKGVIDYNLAGAEVVINAFISVSIYYAYEYQWRLGANGIHEYSAENREVYNTWVLRSLKHISNYYTFSEAEIEALPLMYKYILGIESMQIETFNKSVGDDNKLNLLFDQMEYEFIREDIDFRGAVS